jgi:BCD family chlorophyll transporter-like MFS transporter
MMIAGFIVTTALAGQALDPFSPARLVAVSSAVSAIAMLLTLIGIWNVEAGAPSGIAPAVAAPQPKTSFRKELIEIWNEPESRRFAIFIFVSMLAYSAQDLILEPFAGSVFGMTPGETTKMSGVQHSGALIGMIIVPVVNGLVPAWRTRSRQWIVGGCLASAVAIFGLALAAVLTPTWPLRASVLALGITNGIYAIAAIGAMMTLVGSGRGNREGTRMGVWGASQAISFGIGGFLGTLASDAARHLLSSASLAYALVFATEAVLFIVAARLANRIDHPAESERASETALLQANQGA